MLYPLFSTLLSIATTTLTVVLLVVIGMAIALLLFDTYYSLLVDDDGKYVGTSLLRSLPSMASIMKPENVDPIFLLAGYEHWKESGGQVEFETDEYKVLCFYNPEMLNIKQPISVDRIFVLTHKRRDWTRHIMIPGRTYLLFPVRYLVSLYLRSRLPDAVSEERVKAIMGSIDSKYGTAESGCPDKNEEASHALLNNFETF